MATTAAELVVEVSGRATNIDAILSAVEAKAKQTDTAGRQVSDTFGGPVTAAQQRAANSALQTAAAYARLAVAEGDPARAASILRTALDENVGASERVRVSLQATATRLESGATAFRQFGESAKSSLLGMIGPAALAGAAITGVSKIVASFEQAFEFKAKLDETNASIALQLRGVRDSGQVFSEASTFATKYKLTQEETSAAIQASVPILRTSNASLTDVESTLLRLQAKKPEKSIADAARALDELKAGQIVSIVDQFNVSRDAANKMKDEIAGGADAVQVLSRYLTDAGIGMDALEQRTKGAAGAMRDLQKADEDLALAQAQFASGPGMVILQGRINVTRDLTKALGGDFISLNSIVKDSGLSALNPIIGAVQSYNDAVLNAGRGVLEWAGILPTATAATAQQSSATTQSTSAINLQSSAMLQAAAAGQPAAKAILDVVNASTASAEQSIVATANQQAQTAQTQLLEAQTRLAADAFLQLNPGIDAAGIAALVAAGKIPPLVGQLAAAEAAAYRARDALIAFNNAQNVRSVNATVAQNRAEGRMGRGDSSDRAEMASAGSARLKQLQDLTKAQEDYDKATGNLASIRARAQADLQRARLYGDQEGILKAKTELLNLDAEQERFDKKGAGRRKAAGAAKLSDQQQLGNALLAQQEKTDNQLEDAARTHEKRIADIENAAYEKRIAAEKAFNQDWLDADASFYEQLGSVGSSGNAKIDQQLRKDLSARREAAVLEAQKMGGDQGDAFLKASEAAITKEGEIQDKINKAKQDKNADEAEYLTGVLAAQKRADDARLDSIREGGSAIENERQKQLADEDAAYAEQTGKIETASTRAADAKILQAQRSGKAIDAENLKLQDQAALYDKITAKATGGGAAGGTPTSRPGAEPAPAPAAVTTAGDAGAIVAALLAAQNAIVDALARVEETGRRGAADVAGAVRGARASGGIAG